MSVGVAYLETPSRISGARYQRVTTWPMSALKDFIRREHDVHLSYFP